MATLPVEEMKRHVGWTHQDGDNLLSLANIVQPAIPWVIQRFYDELLHQPSARTIFTGGEEQIERLKEALKTWLRELFEKPHDEAYYLHRYKIGITHVRVGLPQRFMPLAMELVRQELDHWIRRANPPNVNEKLQSVCKALTLDLAVMQESYKETYSDQIRRAEHIAVEEKLTRAEHLAEIGQLAASLAHDIKNPLAGISGAIQVIREGMKATDPHKPILGEILGLISRLDATVKDLLLYARPNTPHPTTLSLHEVVARVLNVLREEPAFQRVCIVFDDHSPGVLVSADEGQVEQLLINLLMNAAHASETGGTIRLHLRSDNQTAQLAVIDKGVGMPPEIRARAFEPFFTTKAKGTGLGLSICRRIVDLHGGTISLTSTPSQGTAVTVALPLLGELEPGLLSESLEIVPGLA